MIWQVTRSYRTNYALVQTLAVDHLNPLTNVSRTGTLTVAGSTTSPATSVTVDVTSATLYGDNSFARAGMVVTDDLDVYTAIAQDTCRRTDTNSVSVTLPSSVSFEHASKGTLTYDGYRRFTYDGLDRLRVVYPNGTLTYDGNRRFTYDNLDRLFVVYVTDSCKPFNRRRIRREYAWLNSGWSQFGEVRYVYDSNLVLCDGNGNVTLLTSSLLSTQRPVAKYIYDSFGNLITMSGPLAEANTCRFSSKDLHTNSGFHCFGRRFYDPNLQRWLSRDPIGEKGGANLYGFCQNSPVGHFDPDGKAPLPYIIGGGVIIVGGGVCIAVACRLHIGRIQAAANAAAIAQMQRLNPNFDEDDNHPNREPGRPADALRHCIGACMANQNPGPCLSRTFVRSRIQAREGENTLMDQSDLANNAVGFGVTGNCVQGCLNAAKNGQLQCFEEGDTQLSPCIIPGLE